MISVIDIILFSVVVCGFLWGVFFNRMRNIAYGRDIIIKKKQFHDFTSFTEHPVI